MALQSNQTVVTKEIMVNRDFSNIQEMLNVSNGQPQYPNMHSVPNTVASTMNGGMHNLDSAIKQGGLKRDFTEAGLNSGGEDSDSENGSTVSLEPSHIQPGINGIKPGKKTKGRVKIKMEFIENKLRRYTTFSKRKTGIMKKAYELSTLTGTQVMLLVASETGHVYTFATRKLQPMITSESGKALIQTCLNSPDPGGIPASQHIDQRMNPTGFEETELSYAVSEEDQKEEMANNSIYSMAPATPRTQMSQNDVHSPTTPNTISMTSYIPPNGNNGSKASNISMQLSTSGLQVLPGTLNAGTPITIGPIQQQMNQQHTQQTQQNTQQLQRFQLPGQLINIPVPGHPNTNNSNSSYTASSQQQQQQQQYISGSLPSSVSQTIASSVPQQTVMYQTPQGVVYATPSSAHTAIVPSSIPEGYLLSLPQTPTLLQDQQNGLYNSVGAQQQFITIPVPVSLASSQVLQPVFTPTTSTTDTSSDKGKISVVEVRKK